jgi:hypothetical protein
LKRFIGYCSIHKLNLFISKAVAEQSVTAFFFARAAGAGAVKVSTLFGMALGGKQAYWCHTKVAGFQDSQVRRIAVEIRTRATAVKHLAEIR